MAQNNKEDQTKNDTLAFIIGGIFILGLVFATYNYFTSKGPESLEEGEEKQERRLSLESLKETLSSNTKKDEEKEENSTDEETQTEESSEETGAVTTLEWQANDYSEGEIEPGTYEVKYGDTLWEVAEAVYGDGTMWTKIRDANSGSIDYLPSGQQALIYAGQTLSIPAN